MWGFAEVVESRAEGVAVGERCYGYWPMGRYLVVQPARVGKHGFVDGAAHRAALPAVYNQIQRCAADPGYVAAQEAQQALLRPLFITSFLIDDFLDDARCFGARRCCCPAPPARRPSAPPSACRCAAASPVRRASSA